MLKNSITKYLSLKDEFGWKFSIKLLLGKLLSNTNSVDKTIEEELMPFYETSLQVPVNEQSCDKLMAWSLWWQGVDGMPEMVKICYQSQIRYVQNEGIEYYLLTKDNVADYVNIPSYILEKVNEGKITLTHLSDIIRILLLEKYGGIWLDLTILFVKPLKFENLCTEFFSININPEQYEPVGYGQKLTQCRWTGFLLATSTKHSFLFAYLKRAILKYWKTHSCLIDYFIMNRLIKLAYTNNSRCKFIIDSVPQTNSNLYRLLPLLNSKYDEATFNCLIEYTSCFKLSYKKKVVKTADGTLTFYGWLYKIFYID